MMPTEAASTRDASDAVATPPALVQVRRSEWRGWFIKGDALHDWIEHGGRPEEIPVSPESVVRDGSRSRCSRIVELDEHTPLPEPLFFKAYRRRPGAHAWLKRMIGWHLPSWVWRMSWRLLEAGVPVPRPEGYVVPRIGAGHRAPFFWAQWIEGAVSAKELARDPARRHRVTEDLQFAQRCAEILALLHNAGVYHRDMNWGNLVVADDSTRVWLIDLDSAHRWAPSGRAAVGRDLARFMMDAELYETPPQWRDVVFDAYSERRGLARRDLEADVKELMREFYRRRSEKRRQRRAGGK